MRGVRALWLCLLAVILAGDLNASPVAAELQPLFARVRDVWIGAADPGPTYPASAPTRRIDYILASPHFTVVTRWVGLPRPLTIVRSSPHF